MNRVFFLVLALLLAVVSQTRAGSRPQWVSKGEAALNAKRTNTTYYFKTIAAVGDDLSSLRQQSIDRLADHIGKQNHIAGRATTALANDVGDGGRVESRETFRMEFKNDFSSPVFYAALVDEYWEQADPSLLHYYALYAVSDGSGEPQFDRFEVSRTYGAVPVVLSVVPGAGQLYKGQKLKGSLMLGAAALGTAAIIYTDNRRSYYTTRIAEQPKFARDYSRKRDNFTTYRNIAIGTTAGLVVWSVLDAALTPGATRIRVSPAASLRVQPDVWSLSHDTAFGLTLALNF